MSPPGRGPALFAAIFVMFRVKNLSLIGGALLLMYFGAGPVSLDARRR